MNMYINHMCTYTYERIAMRPFRQNRYAQDSKPRGCPMTWLPWPTKPVWTHWQTGKEKNNLLILNIITVSWASLASMLCWNIFVCLNLFEPKGFPCWILLTLYILDANLIDWGVCQRSQSIRQREKKTHIIVRVCARYTSGWYVRNYGKIICQGGDHSKQSILCLVFDVIVAAVTSHWFSESLNCPKLGF